MARKASKRPKRRLARQSALDKLIRRPMKELVRKVELVSEAISVKARRAVAKKRASYDAKQRRLQVALLRKAGVAGY